MLGFVWIGNTKVLRSDTMIKAPHEQQQKQVDV